MTNEVCYCCEDCRFWVFDKNALTENDKIKIGECRRYPPVVVLDPTPEGMGFSSFFPMIFSEKNCGEFKAGKNVIN